MDHETQDTICHWTDETFGTKSTTVRVMVRAQEELVELLRALTSEQFDKAPVECADVVIVLCRVAQRTGRRLDFRMSSPGAIDEGRAFRYASQANTALAGLIDAAHRGVPSICDVVDVARNVAACCAWLGADLQAEISAKMQINRARVWKLDGSGHGYHVRTAEPVDVAHVGSPVGVVAARPCPIAEIDRVDPPDDEIPHNAREREGSDR